MALSNTNDTTIFLHFRHFNKYLFNDDIKNQDWALATENNDIALLFTNLLGLFNKYKALNPMITTRIKKSEEID